MNETKQVLIVRKDLNMRTGKIGVMCAHASVGVLTQYFDQDKEKKLHLKQFKDNILEGSFYFPKYIIDWLESSFIKICVYVNSLEELLEIYEKVKNTEIPHCLITDNGKTEFHGNKTITCLAIGPYDSKVLDLYTGHLRLL